MKRLAMTGKNRVEVLEYSDNQLASHEVLVRTEIASGKHGTGLALLESTNFQGVTFNQAKRSFLKSDDGAAHLASPDQPSRLGTAGVGTVVEVDKEVTRWRVGDRVFGLMDIRETNILHEDKLWELGELDPLAALTIEPAYVAFHAVREANLRFGDKVAIIGLGAIGLIAVKMVRGAGAEQVIAVDPLRKRRDLASVFGADSVLDPAAVPDIADYIHELTGGTGVDVAIECAGRYDALDIAIRCTRMSGLVSAVGFYQGEASQMWLGREWHHNRLTMVVPHGCGWGHPPRDFPRWDEPRAYEAIISLMRQGRLEVASIIEPVITIEEGPSLYEQLRNDPSQTIKYAVTFER